ncbi:MAG: hypothetical protein ABIJ97_07850 [Bacteroidota bacterium]
MSKKVFTFFVAVLLSASVFAQSPEKMSYQAVIRDVSNQLVPNSSIGMQITILQDTQPVFVETHSANTNDNGLVSIEIGDGTFVSGIAFDAIDWTAGPYFIQVETDPTGGTTYTITGTSQILSVPYALHAKTAENVLSSETDPVYSGSDAVSITSTDIANLANLSGVNSGDQDLSGYVEIADLVTAVPANETDPVFVLHPSNGITLTNISEWNSAYSWGDHSTIGYLTSFTETDPVFLLHPANGITSLNISNWNTAFGWGDHFGLYRPITYIPDWAEITSTPTTISGYGITDAVTTSGNQTILGNKTFEGTISASDQNIINVADPINPTDAANKTYVDASKPAGVSLGDMQYWDGTNWIIVPAGTLGQGLTFCYGVPTWTTGGVCPPFSIGDTGPGGGLVFYDKGSYSDGWRYLEAAPVSTEWSVKQWGCSGTTTGATGSLIGTGSDNTTTIIGLCGEADRAAKLCSDLVYNGYSDWFLPSEAELNQIYVNLFGFGLGGFSAVGYWSSTEAGATFARKQNFGNGFQGTDLKTLTYKVRAVREF